jgi:catechol 2,3-dioxygenase-like lactoylglutathione lyase family enzyme
VTAKLRCEIFPADLDATLDFYQRVLGFGLVRDERDERNPYLALVLGDVELGASTGPDADHSLRRPPIGVELVIEVDDIDTCYAQVVYAEWPVDDEMAVRAWGLRDFRLVDPSGYYLRITEH